MRVRDATHPTDHVSRVSLPLWIVCHLCPALFFFFFLPHPQDSGGPLWSVDSSRGGKGFIQYGIVSTAVGSTELPCDNSWPTVFMRTSYFYDWIAETVGKDSKGRLL